MALSTIQINSYFTNQLGRPATQEELNEFSSMADLTAVGLIKTFQTDERYKTDYYTKINTSVINKIFKKYFNREATQEEINNLMDTDTGLSSAAVTKSLKTMPEWKTFTQPRIDKIKELYQQLLGKQPTEANIQTYLARVSSVSDLEQASKDILSQIQNTPEYTTYQESLPEEQRYGYVAPPAETPPVEPEVPTAPPAETPPVEPEVPTAPPAETPPVETPPATPETPPVTEPTTPTAPTTPTTEVPPLDTQQSTAPNMTQTIGTPLPYVGSTTPEITGTSTMPQQTTPTMGATILPNAGISSASYVEYSANLKEGQRFSDEVVATIYRWMLGRNPDTEGLNNYTKANSIQDIVNSIQNSDEFKQVTAGQNQDQVYGRIVAASNLPQIWGVVHAKMPEYEYGAGSIKDTASLAFAAFIGSQIAIGVPVNEALAKTTEYQNYVKNQIEYIYQTELGRTVDQSGLERYSKVLATGGSTQDILNDIHKSDEYIRNVSVPATYYDILGREPDAQGLEQWTQWYKDQIANGKNPDEVYNSLLDSHRQSQEYKDLGGAEGEYTRDLMNILEQPETYPEFQWGATEQQMALDYAEAMYGPYYADLMQQLVDNYNLQRTRVGEDYQTNYESSIAQINEYTTKSDAEKARLNEDYTVAKALEEQKIAHQLEENEIERMRMEEDMPRKLAELLFDYEKSMGRLSEDKQTELLKLLEERDTTIGRLNDDETRILGELQEDYAIKSTRMGEDKTRELSQLLEDYTTSGGRLSLDKQQKLEKLTEEYQTSSGRTIEDRDTVLNELITDYTENKRRLVEDQGLAENEVQIAYGKKLEDTALQQARSGMTFSGQRAKEEAFISDEERRKLEAISRQTGRDLYDLETTYIRQKQRTETESGRTLADLANNYRYLTRDTEQYYDRQLEDLTTQYARGTQSTELGYTRGMQDLTLTTQRNKSETQLQAERNRQDILTKYGYNVNQIETQAQRMGEDYSTTYERTAGETQRSYSRNLADLQRQETMQKEESQAKLEQYARTQQRGQEDIAMQDTSTMREFAEYQKKLGTTSQRALEDVASQEKLQTTQLTEEKQSKVWEEMDAERQRQEREYLRQQENYYAQYPRFKTTEDLSKAQWLGYTPSYKQYYGQY